MKLNISIISMLVLSLNIQISANFAKIHKLIEKDADIQSISHAILDVVDKFLVQENNEFNIIIFKEIKEFSTRILDQFLSQTKVDFRTRIEYHQIQKLSQFLSRSSLLFFDSIEDFYLMHLDYSIYRYHNQPFKYIIFIPNMTYNELKSHKITQLFKKLTMFEAEIIHHSYFIVNEDNFIILATVEYFSPKICNQAHFTILNKLDKTTLKWTSDLKNHEKFLDFYGCELVLMLPTPYNDGINLYPSGYALMDKTMTEYFTHGITPVIFNIAAKAHNFIDGYQPVVVKSDKLLLFKPYEAKIVRYDNKFKIPHVFLFTLSIRSITGHFRYSNTFVDLRVSLYVTPAEAYTPYEKLLLPFDMLTWILLVMTFLIAFCVILIVNKLRKVIQNLIYGHNVQHPSYNVIGAFFGISQTRLPKKDFPRFLLALFLMFCLIFRTCYQNKLFEFMTSEPRRAPPKIRSDLIDKNYTVYSMIMNPILKSATDENERRFVEFKSN